MKTFRFFAIMLVAASWMSAVELGDTYEKVIAEKGEPLTKLGAGKALILNYPDQRIKLKAGKVVNVDSKLPESAIVPEDAAPQTNEPTMARGEWTTDYAAALAQGKATNTKVFLFFTGSDWCGWCKRLDREILSTREFAAYSGKNLILVKLDFPRSFALPAAVAAQNQQLAKLYNVRGFPSIIVLDGKGRLAGRMGYQAGGPGPFIEALGKL